MSTMRSKAAGRAPPLRLVASTLPLLRGLATGDLAAAERASGLAFTARTWPDDSEMREGLSVHLAACERDSDDLLWRVYLIAAEHDQAVGHAGFKGGPIRAGELEIYWCVEPRWRGRGIATAAAAGLCQFAFADARVSAITATIARHNVPSQHVAAALGMVNAGEVRHWMPLWRVRRAQWQPDDLVDDGPLPEIVGR